MAQNRKKVFVTGASGFIGRSVCNHFLEKKYIVLGLTRQKQKGRLPEGVIEIYGDLSQPNLWGEQLKSVDIVVHCAGNPKFGNGQEYYEENTNFTKNLISIVAEKVGRLEKFIFISSIAAVDRPAGDACQSELSEESIEAPTSDYGRSKKMAESLVRDSGLPFVIIRPAQVIGLNMRPTSHFSVFAKWVINKKIMSWFSWPGVFSVVDVEDLAAAIFVCAENKEAQNKIYLCGGHHVSLELFFDKIRKTRRIKIGLIKPFVRYCPFKVKSLFFECYAVDDTALRSLGWAPKKTLSQSLEPVINREKTRMDFEHGLSFGQTVVTGAGSGLGKAFAEYLAPRREKVLLVDRDQSALEQLAGRFKSCHYFVCDLSKDEDQKKLLNSSEWTSTSVLELFACAGFGMRGPVSDEGIEKQLDMIRVNFLSRMRLTHKALPVMKDHHFGRIVLISSSSAFQALPGMTSYSASNSGLLLFGEGLAYELRNSGVNVLTVCPGGMKTGFQKSAGVKELKSENLMDPQEVVKAVASSINTESGVLIVSARARAMSIVARVLPRKLNLDLWGWLMRKAR